MWEKIAECVNSESTEMNSFAGKNDAKQCYDKITNQNKKYKNVKDKSKATGEFNFNWTVVLVFLQLGV